MESPESGVGDLGTGSGRLRPPPDGIHAAPAQESDTVTQDTNADRLADPAARAGRLHSEIGACADELNALASCGTRAGW
jgi:hypothetical protein